jgi:hypothetical protein
VSSATRANGLMIWGPKIRQRRSRVVIVVLSARVQLWICQHSSQAVEQHGIRFWYFCIRATPPRASRSAASRSPLESRPAYAHSQQPQPVPSTSR